MNTENHQNNPASPLLPSIVYIVGETSVFVYQRTPESINHPHAFGTHADQIFALGRYLDQNAPRPHQCLAPEADEFTAHLIIAAAESFLSRSVGPLACTAFNHRALIATAFRTRTGRYDVRSIVSLDCDMPIPEQAVLATLAGVLALPEVHQEMESANLHPASRFFDFLRTGRPPLNNAAPQPEVKSSSLPVATSLVFASGEAVMTMQAPADELRTRMLSVASCTLVHSPAECSVEFRDPQGTLLFVQNVPRSSITEKNARSAARAKSLRLLTTAQEIILPATPITGSTWSAHTTCSATLPTTGNQPTRRTDQQFAPAALPREMKSELIGIGNHHQLIRQTNYFESEYARNGFFAVSFNAGAMRLLVPPSLESQIPDMLRGVTHVEMSTLPTVQFKEGRICSFWLFEDHSHSPYCLQLSPAHFLDLIPKADRELPLTIWKKGDGAPQLVATLPARWTRVDRLEGLLSA
jgi:hypothetical protein